MRYVPQTHIEMDGEFYGVKCRSCNGQARWGNYDTDESHEWGTVGTCYVRWDEEKQEAVEGCAFDTLDDHDKSVLRTYVLDFLNRVHFKKQEKSS